MQAWKSHKFKTLMMSENRPNYTLPIWLSLFLCVGLLIGQQLNKPLLGAAGNQKDVQKLSDILTILDSRYVDKVNKDSIFEATINDMLHKLDPHTNYIPAKEMKAMNESIEAKFGGIGVRFLLIRDTICISYVMPNSPSLLAGVKAGDKIIEVNGDKMTGKKVNNEKVMSHLKGDPKSQVDVTVLRNGKKKKITITRDQIPISTITCAYMIDAETGYILIDQFSIPTADEFEVAAEKLKQLGMKRLVLDLRNNGGGVLTSATSIADQFLKEGATILKTLGRSVGKQEYKAHGGGLLENLKVAVLINSNSASASEILAGALQDNDRAIIVGRRSFGKGLVQEDRQLRDGSNLRITIARYYTPSGRCIQRPYKGTYEDYMEDEERFSHGEMFKVDSSIYAKSKKYKTVSGRTVYGGGGITPDVFVPFDSSGTSFYLTELQYSGVFSAFAFDFLQGKRNNWRNAHDFVKTFVANDELIERLEKYASKNYKIERVNSEAQHSKQNIAKYLKAEIARQLWVEEGFYRVLNQEDSEIKAALQALKTSTIFK